MTSIGSRAFYQCSNLTEIISLIEKPFSIYGKTNGGAASNMYLTFDLDVFNNATLYVPFGTIERYRSTDGWSDFWFIEEGTGGYTPPITKKCATPTIKYQYGKLTFNCETEGAVCYYSIKDDDIHSGNGNEVNLDVTYYINVYAIKDGFDNSDITSATLCWIDVNPKTEGINNVISTVRAQAVLIHGHNGAIEIEGVAGGMMIAVYSLSGQMIGSTNACEGHSTVLTNLRSGEVAIVRIDEKSVKIVMQ